MNVVYLDRGFFAVIFGARSETAPRGWGYCCDEGHKTVAEAARCGAALQERAAVNEWIKAPADSWVNSEEFDRARIGVAS